MRTGIVLGFQNLKGVEIMRMNSFNVKFIRFALIGTISLFSLPGVAVAQSMRSQEGMRPMNAEMRALIAEDDLEQKDPLHMDFEKTAVADSARRGRVKTLLAEGKLVNGGDYRVAAFIFQHGTTTNDYLLAHVLANVAISKGDRSALWISNATLDRYLMTIGQKQILGTQFVQENGPDRPFTQGGYDRDLIPDTVRNSLSVRTLSEQTAYLETLESHRIQDGKTE